MQKATLDEISFIKGVLEDYDFYYELKSEPSNIYWSGHKNRPDYNNFKIWYIENVINEQIIFHFICWNGKKVGALYFSINNAICINYGIAVSERVQGRGIASLAVNKFIDIIKFKYTSCKQIRFLIREDNVASIKIHEKLGFQRTGKNEYKFLESDGREIKMEEWIIDLKDEGEHV